MDTFIVKPCTSWSLYNVGDVVLVKVPRVPKGNPPWKGPFKVERILGSFTFGLEDGQVWNAAKMKRWIQWKPEQEQWINDDAHVQRVPPPPEHQQQQQPPVVQSVVRGVAPDSQNYRGVAWTVVTPIRLTRYSIQLAHVSRTVNF